MGVPWWPHLHKINKGSKPLKTFLLVQEGDRSDKLNLVAANAECMVKVLTCQEKRHLARCVLQQCSVGFLFFPYASPPVFYPIWLQKLPGYPGPGTA